MNPFLPASSGKPGAGRGKPDHKSGYKPFQYDDIDLNQMLGGNYVAYEDNNAGQERMNTEGRAFRDVNEHNFEDNNHEEEISKQYKLKGKKKSGRSRGKNSNNGKVNISQTGRAFIKFKKSYDQEQIDAIIAGFIRDLNEGLAKYDNESSDENNESD